MSNKKEPKNNNNNNINFNQQFKAPKINKDINLNPKTVINNIKKNLKLSNIDNNIILTKEEQERNIAKEKERNFIRDKLKCFICYGKVVNAIMCPFCKKWACEECAKTKLEKTKVCSNCKVYLQFDQMIKFPLLDNFRELFINNIEQKKDDIVEKEKDNQIIDFKKEKCKDHPNKYIEYICFNCNEYLCSESLLIFNKESVNKHNNHIIISLEDVNKFKLYNIIKENQSLRENKNKLDIKIKEYKKKKDEIKINNDSINPIINELKNDIQLKYDIQINRIKSILFSLNDKKNKINNKIRNPPNFIDKINNKEKIDHILEDFKDLNNIGIKESDIINEINFNRMIKCESFTSEYIEIKLPCNDSYIEEYSIFKKDLKFIQNLKCKANCTLLLNSFFFSLVIELNKDYMIKHSPKISGNLCIETQNTLNFFELKKYVSKNEYLLSVECSFNEIKNIINKDGKCFCRFLIDKFYYK